jgi:hypothetical protein
MRAGDVVSALIIIALCALVLVVGAGELANYQRNHIAVPSAGALPSPLPAKMEADPWFKPPPGPTQEPHAQISTNQSAPQPPPRSDKLASTVVTPSVATDPSQPQTSYGSQSGFIEAFCKSWSSGASAAPGGCYYPGISVPASPRTQSKQTGKRIPSTVTLFRF